MSRFMVDAEFTLIKPGPVTAEQILTLTGLLAIHGGDAYRSPVGWVVRMPVASSPGPGEAALEAGDQMRAVCEQAELPDAVLTDIHVHRIGGWQREEPA